MAIIRFSPTTICLSDWVIVVGTLIHPSELEYLQQKDSFTCL